MATESIRDMASKARSIGDDTLLSRWMRVAQPSSVHHLPILAMIDESNRISETIRNYLIEFGVEPAKAHEASQRYSSIEAATTWVFGEGEDVSPHLGCADR